MFKVYWQGYGGTKYLAEEMRSLIENLGMSLTTISEWQDSNIIWDKNTWLQELSKADILILPLNYQIQDAKSNNRLTQYCALGKPVICSPLPAYVRIIEKYNCALIASNQEEFKQHLQNFYILLLFPNCHTVSSNNKDIQFY